jgi:hypothetical protein
MITSLSLVFSQNYSTNGKRLSKLNRFNFTIEYPLNEIFIGLLLGTHNTLMVIFKEDH